MEIKIKGNPGTGNSFTEVHIDNVQNYNPNATTIINNNYGTRKPHNTVSQGVIEVDKDEVRLKIIKYVEKTLEYVAEDWKKKFKPLWEDILNIKEVDASVYDSGSQEGTAFNRVLVAGIIRILKDKGVYRKCTNSSLGIALEGTYEHHVRQEIGKYPSEEIQNSIKQLLLSMKYK
jgi:hypothetical protein